MFFIKIYIKKNYMNYYDTSIQMCGQYCILAPTSSMYSNVTTSTRINILRCTYVHLCLFHSKLHSTFQFRSAMVC